MQRVYGTERPLFLISFLISLLVWLALLVGTFGVLLIWVLIIFIIYLFAQSAFISYIKGTGVRLGEGQFPELYRYHLACCEKLGLKQVPEIYILSADGILNALATRFLGRNFVVLFSDIVDALERKPGAVKFYIGHELGHIVQGHLRWGPFLLPASILPLLGAAYSRAREYSCDLHGLACCDEPKDALMGLAVLAAGEQQWSKLNVQNYAAQSEASGRFWMAFHELIGDYPWLAKRASHLIAVAMNKQVKFPRRSFFAWLFALFVPRTGMGAGGPAAVLVFVAVIGILAAIAIPAYHNYLAKARAVAGTEYGISLTTQIGAYLINEQRYPTSLAEVAIDPRQAPEGIEVELRDEGAFAITFGMNSGPIADADLVFEPLVEENRLYWQCTGGSLPASFRDKRCLPE